MSFSVDCNGILDLSAVDRSTRYGKIYVVNIEKEEVEVERIVRELDLWRAEEEASKQRKEARRKLLELIEKCVKMNIEVEEVEETRQWIMVNKEADEFEITRKLEVS